ncbi:MAG TPA: RsmE family RNA methyltransferase, partial [Gemmatimonadaceae bacterium]|nr:RsmE family RNA methyltransferase [Gemmatimonadaceae bacterium]
VRLTSGDGRRVRATITELAKKRLVVSTVGEDVELIAAPSHVELWAPVGDRDRMLWLAEKATELGLGAWRPVMYRRSRSVSPRGEGEAFREKMRARMISALEQSGSAWLPELLPESTLDAALEGTANAEIGILLDPAGDPLAHALSRFTSHDSRFTLGLGPEGGLDPDERDAFLQAGWRPASLGPNVLRFETAALAALAIVRSHPW